MLNAILFKNGELEVTKTVAEVMEDTRNIDSRKAIIPVANFSKGSFTLKSLDCNFHFLKDCIEYARLLECAYFIGTIKVMNSKLNKLEEKELEDSLTNEQYTEKYNIEETVTIFEDVLKMCYTPQEIAFCQADKLIKFMSVYFSKDTSVFSSFSGFTAFLTNLADDKPTQVLKPLLDKVLQSFTVAEDDIYREYHFHANTHLVEDCKKVYYKGRKVAKSKVVQSFDTDGKNVRLEIVLAVIEDLQKKSRKAYEEDAEREKKAEEERKRKSEELIKQAEEKAIKQAEEKAKKRKAEKKAD